MSLERRKVELESALDDWVQLAPSVRKSLVQELGSMAVESAETDKRFSSACNKAANLLHLLASPSDAKSISASA